MDYPMARTLVVADDEKVKIVKALVHSFDVVDDVQHIGVVQQFSLSSKVAAVAFVVVKHVVDSSPVVAAVQMNELHLYVLLVKQKKTVQLVDVVPLSLIVEDFEWMIKHCSASLRMLLVENVDKMQTMMMILVRIHDVLMCLPMIHSNYQIVHLFYAFHHQNDQKRSPVDVECVVVAVLLVLYLSFDQWLSII
jgi:hypothetical protein